MFYRNQNHSYQQPKLRMKLVLICDGSATIVFSEGDNKIFGLSHDQMLNTSLYDIGLTIYSQLKLKNILDDNQFNKRGIKSFVLEAIDIQKEELTQHKEKLAEMIFQQKKESMAKFIKKVYIQFQEIYVKFQSQKMNERIIELKKIEKTNHKKNINFQDTLYMLQIEELYSNEEEIQTTLKDYQITCKNYIQKKTKSLY